MEVLNRSKTLIILMFFLSGIFTACNDDNRIPCVDEKLYTFNLILQDEEENNLFEDEDFDSEALELFALLEKGKQKVEFEIKTTARKTHISSLEASQISLEEGNSFELRIDEQVIASFEFDVAVKKDNGCRAYSYAASSEGQDLGRYSTGNFSTFIITIQN